MRSKNKKRFRGFAFISFRSMKPGVNFLLVHHHIKGHPVKVQQALTKEASKSIAEQEKERKVYVGNLDVETSEASIKTYFSEFGKVDGVKLIKDKNTQKSKGFAFVVFDSKLTALQVVQPGVKYHIDGKELVIELSTSGEETCVMATPVEQAPVSKNENTAPGGQVSHQNKKSTLQEGSTGFLTPEGSNPGKKTLKSQSQKNENGSGAPNGQIKKNLKLPSRTDKLDDKHFKECVSAEVQRQLAEMLSAGGLPFPINPDGMPNLRYGNPHMMSGYQFSHYGPPAAYGMGWNHQGGAPYPEYSNYPPQVFNGYGPRPMPQYHAFDPHQGHSEAMFSNQGYPSSHSMFDSSMSHQHSPQTEATVSGDSSILKALDIDEEESEYCGDPDDFPGREEIQKKLAARKACQNASESAGLHTSLNSKGVQECSQKEQSDDPNFSG